MTMEGRGLGVANDVAAKGDAATGHVEVRATNVLVTLACLSCLGVGAAEDALVNEVAATE